MFPDRYFPGRYYPDRYFPRGGATPSDPGSGSGGYFAGRYFAARYFAARYFPHASAAAEPSPTVPRRDDYALRDIQARIEATGLVEEVVRGASPAEYEVGNDRGSVVWFKRTSWQEAPARAPLSHDRTVSYDLWIAVRGRDPGDRSDRLVQIEAAAMNALSRVKLAGFTMPSFTRIDRGQDGPAATGELRVRLSGSFRYQFDDGKDGRPVTDP